MTESMMFNQGANAAVARCLIIMPLHNRRHFLDQAFDSLRQQVFTDWSLVIVDDGSTDEPLAKIEELAQTLSQPITYIKQQNGGPGSARARGQRCLSDEEYVAFFDSDDVWLPAYLKTMIGHLDANESLDWIFCPCRRINYADGRVLLSSTFLDEVTNTPLNFKKLGVCKRDGVAIFQDNNALAITQLKQPINAGFQNSVLRKVIMKRIEVPNYRIGEDRYFLMQAILTNFNIGYIETVLVTYNVHNDNLSDTNQGCTDVARSVFTQNELCKSFNDIKKLTKDKVICSVIDSEVKKINFWIIGYYYYWQNGYYSQGLKQMHSQLFLKPHSITYAKTYTVCLIKWFVKERIQSSSRNG